MTVNAGGELVAAAGLAKRLRLHSIRMTSRAGSSHVGSCLSVADVMAVLFADILSFDSKAPEWADRDRLIVSKGHAAAVAYAALAEAGFFSTDLLDSYGLNGSSLFGHITKGGVPGVEFSTGSLGHGLPVGTGIALAGKRRRSAWRVFVVMSDGELDEGSNWEAMLFAAHHKLDNLIAIIDYNGIQSLDTVELTLALEPIADKFTAFGWSVIDVDGHDLAALKAALASLPARTNAPTAVIARTVKGKGVSFMENKVLWHYRSASGEELEKALEEVISGP